MAPNAYQKFVRHATPHLRIARHAWTSRERRNTILTVYHTDPTIRQHYRANNTEIPTLSTLFPDEPHTSAEVVESRSHGLRSADLDKLQVQRTMPMVRSFTQFLGPQAPQATVAAATVSDASAQTEDSTPYPHWPPYPWSDDPDLPNISAGNVSLEAQDMFLQTKPHLSEDVTHWRGAKFLGSGSSGVAGLWCKVDEEDNVIDRMVIKDNASFSRGAWRDPKNWRDHLPCEIAVMRRIEARRQTEPDAFQHVIRYRAHRLLMKQRRFRLYTDFASGGNLEEAMQPYDIRWDGIQPRHVPTQRHLPEAFIWHTIKALATACLALETGTLGDTLVDDWKPIFHLDVQRPNILLDLQNRKRKVPADEESDAPIAGSSKRLKDGNEDKEIVLKLADFGLSFFDLDFDQCPDLDENPLDHILTEENTRYAPEHHHYNKSLPERLDTKTDIWGIGRIAWSLIVNQAELHGPVRENVDGVFLPVSRAVPRNMNVLDRYDTELLMGSDDWPAARHYSDELKELVRECLRYDKESRPSPSDVLDRVNTHLEANLGAMEGAMDVGSNLLALPDNRDVQMGELLVINRPGA